MNTKSLLLLLLFVYSMFLLSKTCVSVSVQRRSLHQPFILPVETNNAPSASPQSQPKYTLSTTPPKAPEKSFFPTLHSPPPPPPLPEFSTATPTFPANISSITLSRSSSSVATRHHVIIGVVCSLLAVAVVVAVISAFFLYRRSVGEKKLVNSDNLRLYPPNISPSDSPEAGGGGGGGGNHSSEFLYLGTVINSRGPVSDEAGAAGAKVGNVGPRISNSYIKLGSPELRPLPPLGRGISKAPEKEEEEEEFFSPRGSSSGPNVSPARNNSSSRRMFGGIDVDNFGSRSCNSRTASYPYSNPVSRSVSNLSSPCQGPNFSPRSPQLGRSLSSSSTESNLNSKFSFNSPSSSFSGLGQNESNLKNPQLVYVKLPPPPPPLPPRGYWENRFASKAAGELMCTRPLVAQANGGVEKIEESLKPRLKPLHWDKVRANPDRATVWDQLKSSSFQLNEEMFETLFTVNNTSSNPKYNARRQVLPSTNRENHVLDPKKSHNIAILLRALNVTVDEVCEALLDGNADTLGTELLESLLKMAPSKEEECKLKEVNDEAHIKLGPAEKFLKAVINIPFAFERVKAMLYIANFDSEVEYLRRSFDTLKAACQELKNSRMFLKLLEAVLKTGNRMNIGTNRGDAQAFKLDTLLKLIDIKGTDGRTTLLHFVVQEIIRAEGSRLTGANKNSPTEHSQPSDLRDDVEYRKLGLQVVASLSGELINVKKAATMDSDALSSDVSKLANGIPRIGEVVKLNEDVAVEESCKKFSESMNLFLKKAEEEIVKVQAQMRTAFFLVKEITEYFHGNSEKEEAHPLRIFMVVRDFLSTLDKVCREVGRINDRTAVSTTRQFAVPVYPNIPPVFPRFTRKMQHGSSDDEDSSSI